MSTIILGADTKEITKRCTVKEREKTQMLHEKITNTKEGSNRRNEEQKEIRKQIKEWQKSFHL